MLMRVGDCSGIQVGSCFFRYFITLDFARDQGEVTKCLPDGIEVDFGDTIVLFSKLDIAYVVNTQFGDEHFMSVQVGKLITDFRCSPRIITGYDPALISMENLIKNLVYAEQDHL